MKIILVLMGIMAMICASVQAFDKSDCSLPKEVGPCRKADLSYFYDTASKSCQQFVYGGCHGNNNRFNTLEECQQACA